MRSYLKCVSYGGLANGECMSGVYRIIGVHATLWQNICNIQGVCACFCQRSLGNYTYLVRWDSLIIRVVEIEFGLVGACYIERFCPACYIVVECYQELAYGVWLCTGNWFNILNFQTFNNCESVCDILGNSNFFACIDILFLEDESIHARCCDRLVCLQAKCCGRNLFTPCVGAGYCECVLCSLLICNNRIFYVFDDVLVEIEVEVVELLYSFTIVRVCICYLKDVRVVNCEGYRSSLACNCESVRCECKQTGRECYTVVAVVFNRCVE